MTSIFQRGERQLAAESGSSLFRFGKAPMRSPGAVYSCDWDGSHPILTHTLQNQQKTIPLEVSKDILGAYSFSHPDFGNISFMKARWFEDGPEIKGERGVLLSFQGWSEGLWYDGSFARWQESRLTDLILPGREFRVEWGNSSLALKDSETFWSEQKDEARKQSLIHAVQSKFAEFHRAGALLTTEGESLDDVLNLLLVRLAFPQQKFAIVPASQGMKRLAQNLNILSLREAPKNLPVRSLAIEWGSPAAVRELLAWQMSKSPFIPGKLWDSIKS